MFLRKIELICNYDVWSDCNVGEHAHVKTAKPHFGEAKILLVTCCVFTHHFYRHRPKTVNDMKTSTCEGFRTVVPRQNVCTCNVNFNRLPHAGLRLQTQVTFRVEVTWMNSHQLYKSYLTEAMLTFGLWTWEREHKRLFKIVIYILMKHLFVVYLLLHPCYTQDMCLCPDTCIALHCMSCRLRERNSGNNLRCLFMEFIKWIRVLKEWKRSLRVNILTGLQPKMNEFVSG
jgi:hypothetical protein